MTGIDALLYPASEPFNSGMLKVDDVHSIRFDEHGNKNGIPIVYLHGGPGFGASPYFHRFFDPAAFRIVTYDQRGAARSTPLGELKNNSPALLVEDNEKLRKHLGIDKWHVYGGSWGSTLSLLYAIQHTERVLSLTLRGVFTMRKKEIEWYFSGVRSIMPDAYHDWAGFLPEAERGDLLKSYYERTMNPDPAIHQPAAAAFMRYVAVAGTLKKKDDPSTMPPAHELAAIRIALHFMSHHYQTEFIWQNTDKIKHIPTTIVQGRYDALTPPTTAFDLSRKLDNCSLEIVTAGHSAVDPEIIKGLVAATNRIRDKGTPVLKAA